MYVFANTSGSHYPPNQALIEIVSIAIWNRKKPAIVVAVGIWVVNVAFYLQGKISSPFSSCM
jgi:hypothetical protein